MAWGVLWLEAELGGVGRRESALFCSLSLLLAEFSEVRYCPQPIFGLDLIIDT